MKPDLQRLLGLPKKDSSTRSAASVPRSPIEMGMAQYLGLETIGERAKALPGKAAAAVSRTLGKKPAAASVPLPQASRSAAPSAPSAPAPAASASSVSIVKQAIVAERARAAEIVATGIKAGRINQACALAFDSDLSAREAIAALNAAALDDATRSSDRRCGRMGLDPDQPSGSTSRRAPTASELAAQIISAGEKAAGRTAPGGASDPVANRILAAGARARGETV